MTRRSDGGQNVVLRRVTRLIAVGGAVGGSIQGFEQTCAVRPESDTDPWATTAAAHSARQKIKASNTSGD